MTSSTTPPVVFTALGDTASPQVSALDEALQNLGAVREEVLSALKQDPKLMIAHDMQDLLLQFQVTLGSIQTLRRKMAQIPALPHASALPPMSLLAADADAESARGIDLGDGALGVVIP